VSIGISLPQLPTTRNPIPKTKNNDFVKDPPAGAAKYEGPHPHRHGRRLDDSLSFLNVILFSSILI
jgi:hypothetical protein